MDKKKCGGDDPALIATKYKHQISPVLFLYSILGIAFLITVSLGALPVSAQEARQAPSEIEHVAREIITSEPPPVVKSPRILTLDQCIEIAIKNHLPLKIAEKNVKLARWRLWESQRNMLPKFSFKWEDYEGSILGRRYVGDRRTFDVQHTVFRGGELLFTMKQADINLKIVNKEYTRLKNELILQVRKGYYTLAKAKENFKLQNTLSQEVLQIFDMVSKEFEAGLAPVYEFLNVNSQINQVKFQLASAQGDREVAELILKQAMTIDVRETIDIEDGGLELNKVEVDFEKILNDALVNRAEMQINSLMVTYYTYEKKIARAKQSLKIDLMGSWGLAKEEFIGKDFDPRTDVDRKLEQQWYGGVKASMPIGGSTIEYSFTKEHWVPVVSAFQGTETTTNAYKINLLDSLSSYADRYSSDIDLERARQELIKTMQDITLEVKEGCFSYQKAILQLETATQKVKYQEKDLELTRFKRQMDELQDSNVIDSMIKLAQERFGYIQALSDCQIAVSGLSKAVGIADYFKGKEKKIENTNK